MIIFGSSRSQGNTYDAVNRVMNKISNPTLIDIAIYAYSNHQIQIDINENCHLIYVSFLRPPLIL